MLRRFAAATCVASPALFLAASMALLAPGLKAENIFPLISLWCFVPALWGLWAMLAPKAWVPQRLPLWGAILGLLLGAFAMFALDLPARVFGVAASVWRRSLAVLLLMGFYYLIWLIVRVAYVALAGNSNANR